MNFRYGLDLGEPLCPVNMFFCHF